MEHEDNNTQFANNYLRGNIDEFSLQQNQQNLVENRQIASGFGAGGIVGVVDEIGVSIGGKFVEEEHDEEEWKYIQEVQQSEKQQVLEGERGEGVGNMDGVGGTFVDYDVGRGDGQMLLPIEADDEEEAAIIKNEGDFSTTSNTTSTTVGEEENSTAAEEESHEMQQQQQLQAIGEAEAPPMLQVEMEIEATKLLAQKNNLAALVEESSLATGENCENSQQRQQQQLRETYKQQQYFDEESEEISDCMFSSSSPLPESNKDEKYEENAKPAVEEAAVIDFLNYPEDAALTRHKKEPARPSELDFEMHSNLNPEAKEFVPIHSNPTSPISPNKSHDILVFESFATLQSDASPVVAFGVDDNKENEDLSVNDSDDDFTADVGDFADKLTLSSAAISPHPNAVPRHMIISDATDDVVAQSPRKGRGSDMDAISLPPENEFEHEAAKRPHEIEQEDDLISNSDAKASDGAEVIMNGMEIGNDEKTNRIAGDSDIHADIGAEHEIQMQETTEDYSDFQNRLDHGPETSVDLDMDSQDVMRQSFYIENTVDMQQLQLQSEPAHEQPIEELLNTVQPIPIDSESLNTSFVEGLLDVANKELLYVEEKEVVSNSPSTEELHMRFRNECNAFSNEPTKSPIDMDNVGHMQDSFYMQHTRAPFDTETVIELSKATSAGEVILGTEPSHATDVVSPREDSLLVDTSHPLGINESFTKNYTFLAEATAATAPGEMQQFTHFTNEKVANDLIAPSSPQSTEEKHLMEETKENIYIDNEIADIEHMMNDLLLTHDGSLRKVNEVAKSATPINEDQIELIPRESQCETKADGSPAFEAEEKQERHLPLDNPFSDEVIFDKKDEQQEQMMMVGEIERAERPLLQEPFVSQEMTTEDVVAIPQSPIPGGDTYAPVTRLDFGAKPTVPEVEEPFAEHRPEVEAPLSSAENPFSEAHASVDKTTVPEDEATVSTFESKPVLFADVPVSVFEIPVAVTEVSDPIPEIELSGAVDDAPILATEDALSEGKNIEVSDAEAKIVSMANITTTAIAATAVVATTATVAAVAVSSLKKSEPSKKARTTSSAASKPKVGGDAKKPTENKKLSTVAAKSTTTSGTARPRTAPSAGANKTSATGSSEKKTSANLTTTTSAARPASVSAAGRKPMASNTTSAKHAATGAAKTTISSSSSNSKSTSTATARNGVAAKTTAPRPATATATRKPMTSTLAASTHVPAAAAPKPRLYTGGAPLKPTTLGISAKPKPTLSPRVRTTTSQMSRTGAGLAPGAAKSPLKTAANPNTNGIGKTSSSINNASSTNRTKTTSAGTTKTFTARPAPKTIFTSTTATTNNSARRATTGSSTKTTSSSVLRKSSPSKSTTGGKISPTKTSVAPISKIKTKDVTTLKSAAKSTTATTTITPTKAAAAANVLKEKQLIEEAVELVEPISPKFNGEPLEHTENGDANHTHGEDANGLIEQGEMALMDGSVA